MIGERGMLIIAWELVTLTSVVASAWLVCLDYRSRRALERHGQNGAAKMVAWQDMRADVSMFVALGVIAALGPSLRLEMLPGYAVGGLFLALGIVAESALLKIHDRDELFHTLHPGVK